MEVMERLLNYVKQYTGSREGTGTTPSTPCQMDFAGALAGEMRELGLLHVTLDDHGYVYGFLPAAPGYEACKRIGLIAHLDTVGDFGGTQIRPAVVRQYDGGRLPLGTSGRVLDPEVFADLKNAVGKTLIITDGTTILGADDKAGIAAILTMCERLIRENLPHGAISVCFTPDEEIGHGAACLDLDFFGADYAYTVDGCAPWEIEYETFNAAGAVFDVTGVSVHPGEAKDKMKNAALIAMEINSMLPPGQTPADTEGREGFYHLCSMEGSVDKASLSYIIRDHDGGLFEKRKAVMKEIENAVNKKYGAGTAVLTLKEQYRNMAEIIMQHPETIQKAQAAVRKAGFTPVSNPVRGGTDGAQLSFRGLPCPNLGTGAYALHGPYEHVIAEELEAVVVILMELVKAYAEER